MVTTIPVSLSIHRILHEMEKMRFIATQIEVNPQFSAPTELKSLAWGAGGGELAQCVKAAKGLTQREAEVCAEYVRRATCVKTPMWLVFSKLDLGMRYLSWALRR